MPALHPVSRSRHAGKRWKQPINYSHAQHAHTAPVVFAELPKVVLELPVAFVADEAGRFSTVCLLGIDAGQNLLVGPDKRWEGTYIPAFFRAFPFRLAATAEGQRVFCIDEESGLLSDDKEALALLNPEGQLAEATQKIFDLLQQIEQSRVATQAMCASLQKQGLITAWPLTLKTPEGDKSLKGLHRIDEDALNRLEGEALAELHRARALPLAYFQLLSMQHSQGLAEP